MESSEDRLRAFCSVTFDNSFVVRDLKIIEGTHGPFVAMPSRKLTHRCNRCGMKNYIRSNYCNSCGTRLKDNSRSGRSDDAPNKLYADVAHPINQECRDMIQQHVVAEYTQELERAKLPGYSSRYDDSYEVPIQQTDASATPSGSHAQRVDSADNRIRKPHLQDDQSRASSSQRSDANRPPPDKQP